MNFKVLLIISVVIVSLSGPSMEKVYLCDGVPIEAGLGGAVPCIAGAFAKLLGNAGLLGKKPQPQPASGDGLGRSAYEIEEFYRANLEMEDLISRVGDIFKDNKTITETNRTLCEYEFLREFCIDEEKRTGIKLAGKRPDTNPRSCICLGYPAEEIMVRQWFRDVPNGDISFENYMKLIEKEQAEKDNFCANGYQRNWCVEQEIFNMQKGNSGTKVAGVNYPAILCTCLGISPAEEKTVRRYMLNGVFIKSKPTTENPVPAGDFCRTKEQVKKCAAKRRGYNFAGEQLGNCICLE